MATKSKFTKTYKSTRGRGRGKFIRQEKEVEMIGERKEEKEELKEVEKLSDIKEAELRFSYTQLALKDALSDYATFSNAAAQYSISSLFAKKPNTKYMNMHMLAAAIYLYYTCKDRQQMFFDELLSSRQLSEIYNKLLAYKQKRGKVKSLQLSAEEKKKYNEDLVRYFLFVYNVYSEQPGVSFVCNLVPREEV